MTLRTGVTMTLAAGVSAFGPTVQELQTACAGVAPGRPKDDCTLKRMQDTNAKASLCFQHDSSESHFQDCMVEICGRQADACSGPGGRNMCRSQCMEYGYSQFENFKAIQHVPGAKWEAEVTTTTPEAQTTTAVPLHLSMRLHSQQHTAENLQPQGERDSKLPVHLKLHSQNHSASNLQPQAVTQPHKAAFQKAALQKAAPEKAAPEKAAPEKAAPEKAAPQKEVPQKATHQKAVVLHAKQEHGLTAPSSDDLVAACAGVGAGQATDKCSTTMMRDTNSKATTCYSQNPSNEVAYRNCCTNFCSHSGEACTGHQGQYVCSRQCTEYAFGRYVNLKALTSVPGAASHDDAVNRSPATSLEQHKVGLRGRRYLATPEFDEVKTACAGVAPGIPKETCTLLRMRFTNGNARDCFATTSTSEKSYQSCCTEFCHTESEACTGNGGKAMCFAQCVQASHPLYINLKALSGLPGALKANEPVATSKTSLK